MKRVLFSASLALLLALVGCGTSSSKPDTGGGSVTLADLVPASNSVSGWAFDTDKSPNGAVTLSKTEAPDNATIDGDVVPYADVGYDSVALQFYKNATYSAELRIWQMKDASAAATVYTQVLSDPPATHYQGISFTGFTADGGQPLGTNGRYGFQYPKWYIDTYQGLYFVEARVTKDAKCQMTETDCYTQAVPLVQAVLDKIK